MPIVILQSVAAVPAVAALAAASHSAASLVLAILGIGFLICFHEMGHFFACRLTKTRVETFSIGFGPRLFGWETRAGVRRFTVGARRSPASDGSMDFRVSIVPLGGYVKMAGENPGEHKTGATDEYPSKPFLARVFIITAGVMMNAIAAVGCFTVAYLAGLMEMPPVIGGVGEGGPAWRAGIQGGDRVVAVDGSKVRSFEELKNEIVFLPAGKVVRLDVERGGKTLSIDVHAEYDAETGAPMMGVMSPLSVVIDDGKGPLTIGVDEPVTVGGRYAIGGNQAAAALEEAAALGKGSVEISFPGKPDVAPRTIDLHAARQKPEGDPVYQLGVAPRRPLLVESVREKSAAETAGLRKGDEVLEADGTAIEGRARLAFLPRIGTLRVKKADGTTAEAVVGASDAVAVASFLAGVQWTDSPVVDPDPSGVDGGKSPAAEAGVQPGDRILAVNGASVSTWKDVSLAQSKISSEDVEMQVQTGSEPPRKVTVKPRPAVWFKVEVPKSPVPVAGFFDALRLGAKRTVKEIWTIFRTIRSLVTRDVSAEKNLGGPGTLVSLASRSLSVGLGTFLWFLAIISVNLAVLNILPIPVLDGGHLLFLVVEKIKGSPVSENTIAKAQMVGLVLLLALMAFAVRNDVRFWNR